MLFGFSALPLLTYVEDNNEKYSDTVKTARILAREMIKMVLKTEPGNAKFGNKSLKIVRYRLLGSMKI